MRTIGDLNLITERVSPYSTVSSVVLKMQENGLRVIAVTDDDQFRGIVSRDRAMIWAPDAPVREVLQTLVIEMPASTPVRTAARLFVENGLDYVPIVSDGVFLGLLTANQLLIELGRSWDPMTGLSWSDRLRDWGVGALESGQEVTLAFIDLNGFGQYNKVHGHVVGDRVLRSIAQNLAGVVDPERDVLVRYGGDEFVIGTTRSKEELEAQLENLIDSPISVEGVAEHVTFSVGYAGGKRTRERERIHYASTLDNLINLASQDCLSHKPRREQEPEIQEDEPLLRTDERDVFVDVESLADSVRAVASVRLNGQTALATGQSTKSDPLGAASEAVCLALAKLRPETVVTMDDVVVYRRWDGQPVAIVLATVAQRHSSVQVQCSGHVGTGIYSSLGDALTLALITGTEQLRLRSNVSPYPPELPGE